MAVAVCFGGASTTICHQHLEREIPVQGQVSPTCHIRKCTNRCQASLYILKTKILRNLKVISVQMENKSCNQWVKLYLFLPHSSLYICSKANPKQYLIPMVQPCPPPHTTLPTYAYRLSESKSWVYQTNCGIWTTLQNAATYWMTNDSTWWLHEYIFTLLSSPRTQFNWWLQTDKFFRDSRG